MIVSVRVSVSLYGNFHLILCVSVLKLNFSVYLCVIMRVSVIVCVSCCIKINDGARKLFGKSFPIQLC